MPPRTSSGARRLHVLLRESHQRWITDTPAVVGQHPDPIRADLDELQDLLSERFTTTEDPNWEQWGDDKVVRGGRDSMDKLVLHALHTKRAFLLDGEPLLGVSVWLALDTRGDASVEGLLAGRMSTYRTVHTSTVAQVREPTLGSRRPPRAPPPTRPEPLMRCEH